MSNKKETSFENLNFYIDGEFNHSDKMKIQDILKNNKELDKTVKELQRNDALIYKLYNNIPRSKRASYIATTKKPNKILFTITFVAFVMLIFYTGYN